MIGNSFATGVPILQKYSKKNLKKLNISSAPDFWGRCPGFVSGISHNDPDALQDHWVIM